MLRCPGCLTAVLLLAISTVSTSSRAEDVSQPLEKGAGQAVISNHTFSETSEPLDVGSMPDSPFLSSRDAIKKWAPDLAPVPDLATNADDLPETGTWGPAPHSVTLLQVGGWSAGVVAEQGWRSSGSEVAPPTKIVPFIAVDTEKYGTLVFSAPTFDD